MTKNAPRNAQSTRSFERAGGRVVLGIRGVHEALRARPGDVSVIYFEPDRRDLAVLLQDATRTGIRTEERSGPALQSLAGEERHQGVIAVMGEYPYAEWQDLVELVAAAKASRTGSAAPLIVALDEITDPHNLGAIVRSAVAFGAIGVVTLKDRASPVTPVVVRASAGATEHARIARVTNLARTLTEAKEEHWMQIVGLDADGDCTISALPPAPEGRIVVVGAEGKGLRPSVRKQCDVIASIPMAGPIASLNASVAAGIALHHASLLA